MKTTTLSDIVVNAQAAANEAVVPSAAGALPDELGQQSLKLAKFSESGFDRADYPTWESAFNTQLQMLQTFSKQDSPATTAAKKAAAQAAKA
jgi:hypothetical protein